MSSSTNRHYVIDRQEGTIVFGDGVNGMIPPVISNNIYVREYKCGGGKKANVKKCFLTGLKTTIPNVKSVINNDSAMGGADQETLDDLIIRAPHTIKNRDRAITIDDFEWIAKEASPFVAKTKCYQGGDPKKKENSIYVIIAPDYSDGTLYPEQSLLDLVETYIKDRSMVSIRDSIHVKAPEYVSIDVNVTIVPVSISETAAVVKRIRELILSFLHPISGGGRTEMDGSLERLSICQILLGPLKMMRVLIISAI